MHKEMLKARLEDIYNNSPDKPFVYIIEFSKGCKVGYTKNIVTRVLDYHKPWSYKINKVYTFATNDAKTLENKILHYLNLELESEAREFYLVNFSEINDILTRNKLDIQWLTTGNQGKIENKLKLEALLC